jgi:hypothetical protein
MSFRALPLSILAVACAAALLPQTLAQTPPHPVRVLASNGMKAVVMELQPQLEKAVGHPLSI